MAATIQEDTASTLSHLRDAAAMAIWNSGSVQIADDVDTGQFELQIHRTHPNAPLSPIYLALRPKGVKTGKLTGGDFDIIGQTMAAFANQLVLFDQHRYVAGIPAAGVPFAESMHEWLNATCLNMSPLNLRKVGEGTEAKILPPLPEDCPEPRALQNVLLVDDLVTKAGTKKQAVRAIQDAGGTVTDLLVFVDRSGGRAQHELAKLGVTLHSVWEFDHLLEFWAGKGFLGGKERVYELLEAVRVYPDKLASYLAQQR